MRETMGCVFVGAADGYLGRNTVMHFLKEGLRVVGTVMSDAKEKEMVAWLKEKGADVSKFLCVVADLSQESEVVRAVQAGLKHCPELRHVVNCAGGFDWVKVQDATSEQVRFLWEANFLSNFMLARHWLPVFQKEGGEARMVFISAAASQKPAVAGMGPYVASKAALNSLIDAMGDELKGTSIKVRAVYPTIIDTPRNRHDMPQADFTQWMPVEGVVEKIASALK